MFKSKVFYSLVFVFLLVLPVSAQSMAWYVCAGSYGTQKNAENLKTELIENKLPARIYQVQTEEKLLFRVLINKPFYFIDDAHSYRDSVKDSKVIKSLGITGLWVCKAPYEEIDYADDAVTLEVPEEPEDAAVELPEEDEVEDVVEEAVEVQIPDTAAKSVAPRSFPVEVELTETEVVLDTNETELPVSEETPYSVLVRSYKEEQTANYNKDRLIEQDIDAYVLKKYDEDDYFSFDLHAGAFEEPEQAEELQEKLEDLGIYDTEITDFNDFEEALEEYNEIVAEDAVIYDNAVITDEEIKEVFSPEVLRCIRQFPITENFELKEMYIFDYDNIENLYNSELPTSIIEKYFVNTDTVHAATLSKYTDGLFGNNVTIYVETAAAGDLDVNLEELADSDDVEKMQLKTGDGILDCVMVHDEGDYLICGVNSDRSMLAYLVAEDFTESQFDVFLKNIYNDSELLVYPQVRKNLLVMPKRNLTVPRKFLYFGLSKVQESYAVSKSYADWAIPIVGHWEASAYFIQNESFVNVSFFDMDYDYNAKRVHNMFMEYRKEIPVDSSNFSPDFTKSNAWYSNSFWSSSNELSFSTKSYIIAIDSWSSKLSLEEMMDIGYDLKIWKLMPEK